VPVPSPQFLLLPAGLFIQPALIMTNNEPFPSGSLLLSVFSLRGANHLPSLPADLLPFVDVVYFIRWRF